MDERITSGESIRKKRRKEILRWLGILLLQAVVYAVLLPWRAGGPILARPLASSILLIGMCISLIVMTAWMVIRVALPGRKVRAKIIDKAIEDVELSGINHTVPMHKLTAEFEGKQIKLDIDQWDYNRINVGDEGVLEYKKDEFRGFTKDL